MCGGWRSEHYLARGSLCYRVSCGGLFCLLASNKRMKTKPFHLAVAGLVVMVASLFTAGSLKPQPAASTLLFAAYLGGFACLVVGGCNLLKD